MNGKTRKHVVQTPADETPVASATEMTGLIQALPQDEEQSAACRALIPPPRPKPEKDARS